MSEPNARDYTIHPLGKLIWYFPSYASTLELGRNGLPLCLLLLIGQTDV
jgi:hypothetical protein